MKQLISATLSEEAAEIYNNWERQQKSKILSDIIVQNDSVFKHREALIQARAHQQRLISNAMIALHLKDPEHPLCRELNEALIGTIYYQYWD